MALYATKSASFTPTPEGQHTMVCTQVVDLGTQPGSGMYPAPKRKVMLRWEIPSERIEIDGKDMPVVHSETYTLSFGDRAKLRHILESWRGKQFQEEDFAGPPDGFHIGKLVGVPMLGQIMHDSSSGTTYANLSSAMKCPMPRDQWPSPEGDAFFFDLDEFDQDNFDKLSDHWKDKITNSPEYDALFGSKPQNITTGDPNGEASSSIRDLEDEIPF